jgi:hypothetical protein
VNQELNLAITAAAAWTQSHIKCCCQAADGALARTSKG